MGYYSRKFRGADVSGVFWSVYLSVSVCIDLSVCLSVCLCLSCARVPNKTKQNKTFTGVQPDDNGIVPNIVSYAAKWFR